MECRIIGVPASWAKGGHMSIPAHASQPVRGARPDITQHEIAALRTRFNLADCHFATGGCVRPRGIIENLPNLWYSAANHSQYQSEQEFIETFYRCHGQYRALERKHQIYPLYA